MEREPSYTPESETTGKSKNKAAKGSPEQKPDVARRADESDRRPEAVIPGSLWQRMVGELKSDEKARPTENDRSETGKAPKDTDSKAEVDVEEVPLEALTDAEGRTVATAAVQELDKQSAEHQTDVVAGTTQAEAAQRAGGFRRSVAENLEAPDATTADNAIEGAYFDALQKMGLAEAYDLYDTAAATPEAAGGQGLDYEVQDPAYEGPLDDDDTAVGMPSAPGSGAGQVSANNRSLDYDSAYTWPSNTEGTQTNAEQDDNSFDRQAFVGGLVIGGIVGKLLGNRSGRIKTERQLLPVQRKLEAQVRAIERHLVARDNEIRKLVQERARSVPAETLLVSAATSAPERPAAQFAGQEQTPATAGSSKETVQVNLKPVEIMTREEVLQASEEIRVGATSLRELVATKLVSERGARRVLSERRRGGDVKRVVAEELLIMEIGHELDPQLRDRPFTPASTLQTSGVAADNVGTDAPGAIAPSDEHQLALTPARLTLNIRDQRPGQSALMMANIIALVVLGASIITLIIVWLIRQA